MDSPVNEGRCYCGARTISVAGSPEAVTYCHCSDCRRVSGAPVSAFAAFAEDNIKVLPDDGKSVSPIAGVTRHFCPECGSPLLARYAYLPGQVYVAVGLFDDPTPFAPKHHSHFGEKLPWLCLTDALPKSHASGRDSLNETARK
ncbi:MAG: GFA family protein [Pseudomonadota bacterium]